MLRKILNLTLILLACNLCSNTKIKSEQIELEDKITRDKLHRLRQKNKSVTNYTHPSTPPFNKNWKNNMNWKINRHKNFQIQEIDKKHQETIDKKAKNEYEKVKQAKKFLKKQQEKITTKNLKQSNSNIFPNNKGGNVKNANQQTTQPTLYESYKADVKRLEKQFINSIIRDSKNNKDYKKGIDLINEGKFYQAKLYFDELYNKETSFYNIEKLHLLSILTALQCGKIKETNKLISVYFDIFASASKKSYIAYLHFLKFHIKFNKKKDIRYGSNKIDQILELGHKYTFKFVDQKKFTRVVEKGIKLLEEFKIYQKLYHSHLYKKNKNIISAILLYKNIVLPTQQMKIKFNDATLEAVYRLYEIFVQLELNTKYFTNILYQYRNNPWFKRYQEYKQKMQLEKLKNNKI